MISQPLFAPQSILKRGGSSAVELRFENEAEIAKLVAEIGYQRELGARSLARVVEQSIETLLADEYVQGNDEITMKTNDGPMQIYIVRVVRGRGGQCELTVVRETPAPLIEADEELWKGIE